MLTITINPIQRGGAGGYFLTGGADAVDFDLEWWWTDEPDTRYTKFTSIDGIKWSISVPLSSPTDSIQIRASKSGEISNTLHVILASGNPAPVPTYQFNEFDEIGLEANLNRLPLESNQDFKERVKDVYINPGNASKSGMLHSIERALALPSLSDFFFLSVRFNPLSNSTYKNVSVSFGAYRCSVQVHDWIKYDELVDLDPVSWTFTTQEDIGDENFEIDNIIQIKNASQSISQSSFKQINKNTIWINLEDPKIDATKRLTVTYPFAKSIDYVNEDKSIITVNNVRDFLENAETVQDENGATRSLVVWNNGYFTPITDEPSAFNVFPSMEQAINNQPLSSVNFIKIENDSEPYWEYVNKFKAKGFFDATQLIPQLNVQLTKTPQSFSGSWIKIDAFHDPDFRERLNASKGPTNKTLEYYANQLRELTRMGIYKTVVNKDEWGSDSPERIGDNFIPSQFDGGLQNFTILSSDGTYQELTLNQRRHYLKLVGGQ